MRIDLLVKKQNHGKKARFVTAKMMFSVQMRISFFSF